MSFAQICSLDQIKKATCRFRIDAYRLRKLRLFGCACVSQIVHSLTIDEKHLLTASYLFADQLISKKKLKQFRSRVSRTTVSRTLAVLWNSDVDGAMSINDVLRMVTLVDPSFNIIQQTCLLNDMTMDLPLPTYFVWGDTKKIKNFANNIYNNHSDGVLDNTDLSVLADMMSDFGCDQVELLDHLRSNVLHMKGCQALDLVMHN